MRGSPVSEYVRPDFYLVHVTLTESAAADVWPNLDERMALESFGKLLHFEDDDALPAVLPRGFFFGKAGDGEQETAQGLRNTIAKPLQCECLVLVANGDHFKFAMTPSIELGIEDLERR